MLDVRSSTDAPRPDRIGGITLAISFDFGGTLAPSGGGAIPPDVATALHQLAARYRLVLATNTTFSRRPALAAAEVEHLFSGVVESHSVGCLKPAPDFWNAVTGVAGCPPSQIVHVGNRLDKDVEGAVAAGMRAVLLSPTPPHRPLPQSAHHITALPAFLDLLGIQSDLLGIQ